MFYCSDNSNYICFIVNPLHCFEKKNSIHSKFLILNYILGWYNDNFLNSKHFSKYETKSYIQPVFPNLNSIGIIRSLTTLLQNWILSVLHGGDDIWTLDITFKKLNNTINIHITSYHIILQQVHCKWS